LTYTFFDESRGQFEATPLELYIGLSWPGLDLRIGQQRVAWGRSDVRSPNDVLNRRDLRDPLLAEPELRDLPTPLVRGDIELGFGSLELVFAPFFFPDRFDLFGSNWALVQPDAPPPLRGFFGLLTRAVDPALEAMLQPLLTQTSGPRLDIQ